MGASESDPTSPSSGPPAPAGAVGPSSTPQPEKRPEKRPNLRLVPPRHDSESRRAIREATDGETTPSSSENLLHLVTKPMHFPAGSEPSWHPSSHPGTYRLWFRKKSGGPATSLLVSPHELVDDVKTRILQKYPTSLQQRIDPADLVLTVPQQSGIRLELQPDEEITKVIDEYFHGDMKMSDALEIGASVAFWNGSQWGASAHSSVGGHTPATTPNTSGCPSAGLGVNSIAPSSETRGPRSAMQRTRSFGQWGNSPLVPSSSPLGTVGFPFPSTAPNTTPGPGGPPGAGTPSSASATPGPTPGPTASGPSSKPNTPVLETRSPGTGAHTGHLSFPSHGSHANHANHANHVNHANHSSHASPAGSATGAQSSNHSLALSGKNSRSNSSSKASSVNAEPEAEVTVQLVPLPEQPVAKPQRVPPVAISSSALAALNIATDRSQPGSALASASNSSSNLVGLGSNEMSRLSIDSGVPYDFDYDMEYGKWKFSNMQLELSKGTVVPQIKMLIVEDNRINQQILERFLRVKKVQYEVAQTGREALDKWKTGKFHLILMDIQLPVMTGLEATQEIRRLEAVNGIGAFQQSSDTTAMHPQPHPHDVVKKSAGGFRSPVIIVALTASSDSDDLTEALAAGCNDFLTKPVNFAWLERKIIEWGCMQALIDFDGWKTWNVDPA